MYIQIYIAKITNTRILMFLKVFKFKTNVLSIQNLNCMYI